MSGGYFDYAQSRIDDIADRIEDYLYGHELDESELQDYITGNPNDDDEEAEYVLAPTATAIGFRPCNR